MRAGASPHASAGVSAAAPPAARRPGPRPGGGARAAPAGGEDGAAAVAGAAVDARGRRRHDHRAPRPAAAGARALHRDRHAGVGQARHAGAVLRQARPRTQRAPRGGPAGPPGRATSSRRDRYGRLLAYVYREPDDLFVNERAGPRRLRRRQRPTRRTSASPTASPPSPRGAADAGEALRRPAEAHIGLFGGTLRAGNADASEPRRAGAAPSSRRPQVAQVRAVETVRETQLRARQRELETRPQARHACGSSCSSLALIGTAVLVTVAMFETLYYVMG